MLVCHGVVKNNVIFIPSNQVKLFEGMRVEVRIPSLSTEEQFKHKLLKLGLVTEIKNDFYKASAEEQPLAQIQGKSLSQMIIEERR